jgi:serine/threonine-protein kinase
MKVCEICRARFRGNPTACPLDGGRLLDLPDPLLGRLVAGRYVVQEKIGAGGMGTVYRATHEVLGRTVAIKFLSPELAVDPTSRQRFLREAKAANRIKHDHIIEITDFGETDDGLAYLVMEYLEGKPLTDAIEQNGMGARRALGIALQVAQALARAHELDITHRDIKPDNIYLLADYDGDFIKILDFGLAHMKGELRLTATGTVFGTPEYMAPEQARGMKSTSAVDIYALGCVLFEMLTGRLPFEGRTPDLILKHMREPPPRPSSLLSTIGPALDDLVLRLLAKDPDARPKNAYALSDEIRNILESLGSMRAPKRTSEPRPFVPTALSQTVVTEDAWEERVAIFRRLVSRAHPHGPPPWLLPTIDELAERIRSMRQLRRNLDDLASQAARRENDMREVRMRIGRALDELAQDEARVQRALAETRDRWREAKERLDEIERPVLRAWAEVPPMPAGGPAVDREVAEALRDAGQLAAIWIEADRSVGSLQRDMLEREREIEDLRFQVSQLKGRLGTVNAEGDLDTSGNREETSRLDADLRRIVDDIVRTAEPVYRHFMAFPELRNEVLNSGQAAAG